MTGTAKTTARTAEDNARIYAEMLLERRTKGIYVTASEWEALAAYAAHTAEITRQAEEARRLLYAARDREVQTATN